MNSVITLITITQIFSLIVAANFNNLNDFQDAGKRYKRAARTCLQPPVAPDKEYTIRSQSQENFIPAKPGEIAEESSIIKYRCNDGYVVDYQTNASKQYHLCISSSWEPPIPKCKRICKAPSQFSHMNMSCHEYSGGPKVSCDGLLLEGAIVIPECQPKFRPNIQVNYDYATCREDGTWDKSFFNCEPECGLAKRTAKLMSGELPEIRGGSPWNVAIYSTQFNSDRPEFICGGTLISAQLVISAAHCFYNETNHENLDKRYFRVIVGKVTIDYHKEDFNTTKKYELKDIHFPKTPFKGAVTYAADIAILQLSDKVSFSQDVLPACLHFDDVHRYVLGESERGKLSGFGATANSSLAQMLLTAHLPYISNGVCLEKIKSDFQSYSYIPVDIFCAGSEETGTAARKGDSGGGLLFMDKATGLFHLRGVVSNRDFNSSSISSFTDVAQYISWISKTIETVENPGCKCNSIGTIFPYCEGNNTICKCKPNVIGKHCDRCAPNTSNFGEEGCNDNPAWLYYANGEKCPDAVIGGKTSSNESVYVARHEINGHLFLGELVPSQKLVFIAWNNERHNFSDYEVLCGRSMKWVEASDGEVSKKAIAGGIYKNGNINETVYICRKRLHNGSVLLGRQDSSSATCKVIHHNYEYLEYEVLVRLDQQGCECNAVGTIFPFCVGASKICKCKPNVIGENCDRCAPNTYNFGRQGCNEEPRWLKYSNGEKCANAIVGGENSTKNEVLYIARQKIDGQLHPGLLVSSQKLFFLAWSNTSRNSSDYELLCGSNSSMKWVAASNGVIPERAVAGGVTQNIWQTVYVCRARTKDQLFLVPGKIITGDNGCHIGYDGKTEYKAYYDVLVRHDSPGCECNSVGTMFPYCEEANRTCTCKPNVIGEYCDRCAPNTYNFGQQGCNEDPKWIKYENGEKCSDAVVGGSTLTKEIQYIARHEVDDGLLYPGRLVPSQKLVFLAWGDKYRNYSDYEVLCGGSMKWVEVGNGKVPERALAGGFYVNGSRVETVYICRYKANNGQVTIGRLIPSNKYCFIEDAAKSYWQPRYEVLVKHGDTGCECNPIGTIFPFCEGASTTCKCKPNVIGVYCDRCAPNTYNFGQQGCNEDLKWLKFSNGEKCSNAVVGGTNLAKENVYIARFEIDDLLYPGSLVPSQKMAYQVWGKGNRSSSEYEVLCGGSLKWISASNGGIPERAVAGGTNGRGKDTIYICRTYITGDGSVVVGWRLPNYKRCYVIQEGLSRYYTAHAVLVKHGNTGCDCNSIGTIFPFCEGNSTTCKCKPNVIGEKCDRCAPNTNNFGQQGCSKYPKWYKYSNGDKCPNAVIGGTTPQNEILYIARHILEFILTPGKLDPSQKLAFIPWESEQRTFSEYEVLCGGSTKWVASSDGIVPAGAVNANLGDFSFKGPIYVCRATDNDGSVVPGKLITSQKVCYFANEGTEHGARKYEVLVID